MAKLIGKLFFQTHGFLTMRNSSPILRLWGAQFCTNLSSEKKNLYSVLGVTPKATTEEIKNAYYKLSQKYHPDKHGGDKAATAKFLEIKEAHELLSDPAERETYDAENFPKHSQNSYPDTCKRKEFKFHFYKPKKNPYDGYAEWETVKDFSKRHVFHAVNQQVNRSAKGLRKRKQKHLAQKCAYQCYAGTKRNAKMIDRRSYQMCNLK